LNSERRSSNSASGSSTNNNNNDQKFIPLEAETEKQFRDRKSVV
jgi:hypothetical protein